jgi:hypothetical protein
MDTLGFAVGLFCGLYLFSDLNIGKLRNSWVVVVIYKVVPLYLADTCHSGTMLDLEYLSKLKYQVVDYLATRSGSRLLYPLKRDLNHIPKSKDTTNTTHNKFQQFVNM